MMTYYSARLYIVPRTFHGWGNCLRRQETFEAFSLRFLAFEPVQIPSFIGAYRMGEIA